MKPIIIASLIILALSGRAQVIGPDLTKQEDLKKLGVGKIFEKDEFIIKHIMLVEIKEKYIVYEKDGSLHDLPIEVIRKIEFPESIWKIIYVEFNEGKVFYYHPVTPPQL
ncbi:MAG: hypothetical protein ACXVC6_00935 [Bacteroidia bacterium]